MKNLCSPSTLTPWTSQRFSCPKSATAQMIVNRCSLPASSAAKPLKENCEPANPNSAFLSIETKPSRFSLAAARRRAVFSFSFISRVLSAIDSLTPATNRQALQNPYAVTARKNSSTAALTYASTLWAFHGRSGLGGGLLSTITGVDCCSYEAGKGGGIIGRGKRLINKPE